MTGYGRGRAPLGKGVLRVEVKTFNHKFFELSYKLPEDLQPFDEKIKKLIREKLNRGKLYLWITQEHIGGSPVDVCVDEKRAGQYVRLMRGIKKKYNLKDDISLSHILALPDVIIYKEKKENSARQLKALSSALVQALDGLVDMRVKEGKALEKDLASRLKNIERSLKNIKTCLPQEINNYRKKLKTRFKKCFENKNNSVEERIETEVSLFAKNSDISEEITRIFAHIDSFRDKLKSREECGKVMDFIAQEIQREINTIGSKSSDVRIAKQVIYVKGEIEKIREQVQNVE